MTRNLWTFGFYLEYSFSIRIQKLSVVLLDYFHLTKFLQLTEFKLAWTQTCLDFWDKNRSQWIHFGKTDCWKFLKLSRTLRNLADVHFIRSINFTLCFFLQLVLKQDRREIILTLNCCLHRRVTSSQPKTETDWIHTTFYKECGIFCSWWIMKHSEKNFRNLSTS